MICSHCRERNDDAKSGARGVSSVDCVVRLDPACQPYRLLRLVHHLHRLRLPSHQHISEHALLHGSGTAESG